MEMLRRLAHDLRDPTAFSPRSRSDRRTLAFVLSMFKTNAVTRRSLATMATTSRCLAFLPRYYHVYTTLMATWARSGPIFRPRRRAVRTPPRCEGGIKALSHLVAIPRSCPGVVKFLRTPWDRREMLKIVPNYFRFSQDGDVMASSRRLCRFYGVPVACYRVLTEF